MDEFLIIDGNSLINRAFYALPPLANFEGVISNGAFGFTTILIKIITERKPKYIAVAFDYSRKTFRNDIFKDYKATRKETPPELLSQFPILKDILDAMQINRIEQKGIEADDIIGTLTKKFDTHNIVLTGDRDCLQLINSNTNVIFTKRGVSETILYNEEQLLQDYYLTPSQVIDLKALMGDSSDNIPGIKGVGEKTAFSLLSKYKNLQGVYDNLDEIPGKLKEKLEAGKEIAFISYKLATIKTDCQIDAKLEDFKYNFPFNQNVYNLFTKYQFNSLLKRKELFLDVKNDDVIGAVKEIKQKSIKNLEDIDKIIENIIKEKYFYFSLDEKFSCYVNDVEYNLETKIDLLSENLEIEEVLQKFKSVFENNEIKKCVFDYKNILHKLTKYNITLSGVDFDVLIARYLINSNNKTNITFNDVVTECLLSTNYTAYNLKELKEFYLVKIKEFELEKLFYEIELPLSDVLFDMEHTGFKINQDELQILDNKYSQELSQLTLEIYDLANEEFNINSPKQLSEILFEKINLPTYFNKKKSTAIDVLNNLIHEHPIIDKIIRYRHINKLYTTYIKSFEKQVNKKTGKINTIFNQTLTSTGRLSSSEPNLQNVPIRTEEGKSLRKIFIPTNPEGYIVAADYSQIELRLLAAFSKDEKLIKAFSEDKDIHTITASEVLGVNEIDVTPQMRRDAKAINFGIIYGISDYGLSQNIGTTRKIAKDYIDRYFQRYPNVKNYMDSNILNCKEMGYIKTYFGRIRFIPEINSSNFNLRSLGERAAMNMPLQGTASDIIKIAMIKIYEQLNSRNLKSKLILQIHDELIIDCAPDELDEVKEILKNTMENVVKLPVNLDVNISHGKSWYET